MRLRLKYVEKLIDMVYLIVLLQQYALHFFFGLVTDTDQTMIIDKNKVRRERNVFRNKLVDDSQPNDTDEPITAIYFDGRKDQTSVHFEDTNGLKDIKEEY